MLVWSFGPDLFPDRISIYLSGTSIVVAFMGTNSTNQVSEWENSQTALVQADPAIGLPPGLLVMKGFNDLFLASWNDNVKRILHQLKDLLPLHPIVITDHSQGVGTSLLTAMAIAKEFSPLSIYRVITYRPPRAGNPAWADAFDAVFKGRYTGVTNGNDWVSD